MPESLSHDEISARFLESGSINFDAIGKFLTEVGPELATRDDGLHGVILGHFRGIACFLTADELRGLFGGLRITDGLAQALNVPGQR